MTKTTIRDLREQTGKNRRDFAKIAGVSSTTLYRIEQEGSKKVQAFMLHRVLKALSAAHGEKISLDMIEEPTKALGTVDKVEQA